MDKNYSSYFEEPITSKLEANRAKKRDSGKRLIYDCFNAQVDVNQLVSCRKGRRFRIGNRRDGKMALSSVLRGNMNPAVCQNCPDYDDKDE